MVLNEGSDSRGIYYMWGELNTKHYYKKGNAASKNKAKEKAEKQGRRIEYKEGQ